MQSALSTITFDKNGENSIMRKHSLLALLLVFTLLFTSSCSLFAKDETADRQTVIVELDGKTITKGEVLDEMEYVLDYYEYLYTNYYGIAFDRTSKNAIDLAKEEAVNGLLQNAVVEKKIAEKGYDVFTAEEEAAIQTTVDEAYDSMVEFIKSYYLQDTELTGEALEAAIAEQMPNFGYGSKEEMLKAERLNISQNKLAEEIIQDVTVTEDEIVNEYTQRMLNAKETYEEYPEAYGTDLTNGTIYMYYAPAGYRYVKHILLTFTEEDQSAIGDLDVQIMNKQTELESASKKEKEAINAEIENLNQQMAEAKEKAYQALQPTIDEINAKLAAGESFESLIEAYNQDPGMLNNSQGYAVSAVSTNWVTEFTEGAMALEKIGDVSEPVRSSYGIHLIQYASDIPEGEIGLENVREELENEVLLNKQNEKITTTVNQWVEEADAKIHMKRL